MGSSERRARERGTVRKRILVAARDIVYAEGTAALTMRRIADAIEYAPATLYQYFENREAIVRELCLAGYGELLAALRPALEVADPFERLEAIGRGYVEFGLAHPQTYRLVFMEDPAITSAIYGAGPIEDETGAGRRAFAAIVTALEELRRGARLAADVPLEPLADAFWAALHGVVSLKLSCPAFPATPPDVLLETTLQTFLRGLPGLRPAFAAAP